MVEEGPFLTLVSVPVMSLAWRQWSQQHAPIDTTAHLVHMRTLLYLLATIPMPFYSGTLVIPAGQVLGDRSPPLASVRSRCCRTRSLQPGHKHQLLPLGGWE